jgi:hypothetical protein
LIETVQFNEFDNIDGNEINAHLDFTNPTKAIFWFVQPQTFRYNKCKWNSFFTVENTYIRLNGINLIDSNFVPTFFDRIVPYSKFNCSKDGLYCYSFALKPLEYQPSSTINSSVIKDFGLVVKFTSDFIQYIKDNDCKAYLGVYSISYNILRIVSGMAGLAIRKI